MNNLSEHPRYQEARHYVEQLKGFYTHAAVYVLVNLGLFALAQLTGRVHSWYPWPALAWGIGLVGHGVWVYALGGLLGSVLGGAEDPRVPGAARRLERVKGIKPSS